MRRPIIATLAFVAAMLSTTAHGQDDHGNTRAAATSVVFPSETSGNIDPGSDEDYFSFTLSAQTALVIETNGVTLDTQGWLYDSAGTQLATDDDSGFNDAFRIARTLNAGTYYVRVGSYQSNTGAYILRLFTSADDHANARSSATSVFSNSDTLGIIYPSSDEDYFSFTLSAAGSVTIQTTSSTDTQGWLYNSAGTQLASNDDSGSGTNFQITQTLNAGTYYVRVGSFESNAGPYTLQIRGPSNAPSFASGSVTNKTYIAASPIAEFVVPAASGGEGTITYAASGLPTGLVFDATGTDTNGCPGTEAREICGTPTTAASAATVTITAQDGDADMGTGDRATLTFSVTVNANLVPSFSGSVTNKTYVAGQAIDEFQVPAASGGNGAITYAASNLPDGLRFDATGADSPGCPGNQAREICGTPTTAASAATVTITAQDGDANRAATDRATLTFTVAVETNAVPTFGSGTVSNKTYVAGQAITDFTVPAASGGNGAITYAASNLPDGLVFDATGTDSPGCTGTEAREICGTPTTAGAARTVTITADDADANMASGDQGMLTFTIAVDADTAPSFGMGSVTSRTYVASSAIDEFQVPAASGGNGTIVYTASGLPAGLVFDATGTDTNGCPGTEAREICGTPTTAASAVTVTIAARDSDGNTMNTDRATLTFSVTVEANAVPTFGSGSVSARTFVAGQAIDEFTVPAASGGNGTITYSASNLPDGLRFDATGSDSPGCPGSQAREVCGTPTTAAAAATVTITAQDGDANMAAGDRDTLTFTVTVETNSAPDFGTASVTNRIVGVNVAITDFQVPAASGGNGTVTYTASGLPAGLRFDATGADTPGCTGTEPREICGTPTTIGAARTVTITARDSDGDTTATDRDTLTFTITVSSDAPPSFGSGSVPEKAFILNAAIADFQVPAASGGNGTITYAASGLPTGLVFDATGTDATGCSGTEAREICGTPSVAGTGTITITAQDGDTNMGLSDRATLQFAYSVAADSAPTFSGSVTAKTYPAGAAITDFVAPAASGGNGTLAYAASNLPSGLVFDATGTDSPGCPGTEAREVCGTPDAATAGAVTVTITATDLDTNTAPTDRATLTFTVTVTAGASLASSPSPLTEANLNGATLTVTLIGATYASGVGASSFQLATAPTIAGLSIGSVSGGAAGSTTATLTLATGAGYGFNAASTVAVTVLAAAHSASGNIATGTLPVTPTPPSVLVSRRSLSLNEDPGAGSANRGTYTLALSEAPTGCTGGVVVSVASGNPDVTPEPTTLTFTPDDWNAPQTVTVTAEQDDDGADDRATLRHAVTAACAAAGYPATLAIPSVEVTVDDDDAPPPAGDVPTEVRAEATATGLLVTWTAAAGATSYKVQWRLAGQEWSSSRQEETTATRLELDLEPGGYEVRVVAVADGRDGAASAAAAGEVAEPVNTPPRLAEELPDLQLDVGETRTVDLDAAFEDPNGDRLRYSASSDGAAVSVRATASAVRVRGVRPGEATVTVTATDPEGLGATATFDVAVGALLSLSGDAAAPEGGAIVLTATLGRPLAEPLAVSWRIAPDDDPATPDADASDYESAGAATIPAGETTAAVEIAVVDDADIEPARERFVVELDAPETANVGLSRRARATVAIQEGVCDRTPAVRDALARGWRDCRWPRPADLARIPALDLNARDIDALRGNDLLGLDGLERLDLRGNALSVLPAGLLSHAPRLERLDLSSNALEALPPGLFAGLPRLREVSVADNPGAPFGLALELLRTDAAPWAPGPATITTRAALGAPFPLAAMLSASPTPAAETDLPATVRVEVGETNGTTFAAAQPAGSPLALRADAPPMPTAQCNGTPCFRGFETVPGSPLILFHRPPRPLAAPAPEPLAAGDPLRLPLASLVAPGDAPDGMAWEASSSDASVATAHIVGAFLLVEPELASEGAARITLVATDALGFATTVRFEVQVEFHWPHAPSRGWRSTLGNATPDDARQ